MGRNETDTLRPLIVLENIEKSYASGKERTTVLNGVSLSFGRTGLVAILGASGSGKTTLLNILSTLDREYEGTYLFDGKDVLSFSDAETDDFRNKRIGFVFQESLLLDDFSLEKNILLATEGGDAERRMESLLSKVGLLDKKERKAKYLSGGEKQRGSIVRALINDPDVLLADEPTGALDSRNALQVMAILKEISKDRLVLVVTHNEEQAERFADVVVRIQDGVVSKEQAKSKENPAQNIGHVLSERKAFRLSLKKTFSIASSFLVSKKLKTAFAMVGVAISILGLSLVLAVQHGFSDYLDRLEGKLLNQIPIAIETNGLKNLSFGTFTEGEYRPATSEAIVTTTVNDFYVLNNITDAFVSYMEGLDPALYDRMDFQEGGSFHLLSYRDSDGAVVSFGQGDENFLDAIFAQDLALRAMASSKEDVLEEYDLVYGRYPEGSGDMVLVLGSDGSVNGPLLEALGVDGFEQKDGNTYIDFEKLTAHEWTYLGQDAFYQDSCDEREEIEQTGIFLRRSDELRAEGRSLYDLANLDLGAGLTKETAKQLLPYIDVPKGVHVDLDAVDFADEKDVSSFFLSLFQTKTLHVFRQLDDAAMRKAIDDPATSKTKIVGVLQAKEDSFLPRLRTGIYYMPSLVEETESFVPTKASPHDRSIADCYQDNLFLTFDGTIHVRTRTILGESTYDDDVQTYLANRKAFNVDKTVEGIVIYPKSFDSKEQILAYVENYNATQDPRNPIVVTDLTEMIFSNVEMLVDIILFVLLLFTAVSLLVAFILIVSILYASVLERTREIGLFRALGAKKADVGRIFRVMSLFIGFCAGAAGIILGYAGSGVINAVVSALYPSYRLETLANLPFYQALLLLLFSVLLSYLASLAPSTIAARRNPILSLKD